MYRVLLSKEMLDCFTTSKLAQKVEEIRMTTVRSIPQHKLGRRLAESSRKSDIMIECDMSRIINLAG